MDGTITVPILWLFAVAGVLLSAFVWWLRTEWGRNWKEHDQMRKDAKNAHDELDRRIDQHHGKIDHHLDRIHSRIDWLITHSGIPTYEEKDDG